MLPPNLSESFKYRKLVKLTVLDPSFPNFSFSLESSKFIIGRNSVVFLKGISSPYF